MDFEAEVRRVAEAVWNLPPGHCQPTHYPNDPVVRELDGIARLRDVTHLIMATTSTRLEKAKDDVKKLLAADRIERTTAPAVSKWLITRYQLDAQHIEHARKANVLVLTLEQFQRRFFDSGKYLSLRAKSAFGSARDPNTDSITIAKDAYVTLPMRVSSDFNRGADKSVNRPITLAQIAQRLLSGDSIVLRAPFGSGKSLTTRELHEVLADMHRKNPSSPVPITLSLREHWGEDFADEMLERHARSIGYTPLADVVVAWRSGMCCLLLDGFDEVAAQTVVRTDNKNFMRDARRRALQGIRDFTQKVPEGAGVFLCGRDHYFDNDKELVSSLGLAGHRFSIVELEEFSEDGANQFLSKNKVPHPLPDWLPRKPLILAYLLRAKLFSALLEIDSSKGFGFAWDCFLTRICERESALESSSMDPETIRCVLERLADLVRAKVSGTGPITGNDLADAYTAETGQAASEGVLAQLQRLPGLTQRDSDPGTRAFVDHDMLGALQGGAFARQVLAGFQGISSLPLSELSERGVSMAIYRLGVVKATPDTLINIAEQLSRRLARDRVSPQVVADCALVAIRMAIDLDWETVDFRGLIIDGATISRIPMDEIRILGLTFRNCTVREIAFGEASNTSQISFGNCLIDQVSGVSSVAGVPKNTIADDCEISRFDSIATTTAVLQLDLDPQVKALITILRKLYKQSGAGRKLGAFSRGITRPDVLSFIAPVLDVLERHRFISVFNSVVHPVRKQASRVEKILASPSMCNDELIDAVRALR